MPLDPAEGSLQLLQKQGGEQKRHAEPEGIGQQEQEPLCRGAGVQGLGQSRAEKGADAGGQADRVDDSEEEGGGNRGAGGGLLHALQKAQRDDLQIGQAEKHDQKTADDFHGPPVAPQKAAQTADRSHRKAEQTENQRKTDHKGQSAGKGLPFRLCAGRKIGDIERQQRQHTGRDERDHAL